MKLEVASTASTADTERELDDGFDALSPKSLFDSSAASTASFASSEGGMEIANIFSSSQCHKDSDIFSPSQSHKDFDFMTSSPTSETVAASLASQHTMPKAPSEMEPLAV